MSGQGSGRILGTIVGAAVAYFTGGVGLIGLGATLGGAVGSLLDPKQIVEGPRLEDLKVQVSTYGIGVPRLYGTERFGGNVIWSTDKLEIATDTEAGKGGGVVNRSYKYYVHMSLLLCETPRDGSMVTIIKIFQDGKLIWDASSGIPVGSALASAENPYSAFELFQGHQDQLPDSIEESWTGGPGSCSAYRGVVRIRMIAIECPGGRVPQFSFVLSNTSAAVSERLFYGKAAGDTGSNAVIVNGEVTQIENYPLADSQTIRVTPIARQATVSPPARMVATFPGSVHWSIVPVSQSTTAQGIHPVANSPGIGSGFGYSVVDFDAGAELTLASGLITDPWATLNAEYAVKDPLNAAYMLKAGNKVVLLPSKTIVTLPSTNRGAGYYDELIRYVDYTSSKLQFVTMDSSGFVLSTVENPTAMGIGVAPLYVRILASATSGAFYVVTTARGGAGSPRPIWKVSPLGWTLLCADTGVAEKSLDGYMEVHCTDTYAVIGPSSNDVGSTEVSYQMVRFNAVNTSPVKVKDIIVDQCQRAGITTYDVSGIPDSDTVIGYKIATPASARANIEPLLTLIGGYVVDEDGVTKFKKFADITSVATVSFDELGQAEGDAAGEAMPLNRTQEIDLPRSVTTSYIDQSNDYQTASETEVRQVTSATEDTQIQLPICVTSDQAKKVSQMALYDRWRRQNTRSTTVSRKFAAVSPGDGVTIEYPRGTFKLWLLLSTNDTGAVCEWSLCPGDAAIFTQTAIGATGYVSQMVEPLAPATQLQLIDGPILQDADNNAGVYGAMEGFSPDGWGGAELYVGNDDSNLESRGAVSNNATIGFAEGVLGGWSAVRMDESNTVIVNVGQSVLSSVTQDAIDGGTANAFALGANGRWEYGQFRTASSLGSGRYLLSGFARGAKGTERNRGNHAVGDVFVLLSVAGMLRPTQDAGSIGQAKSYRAITKGRSLNSAVSQSYANTGESLKPYSPWDLRVSRDASNNVTLTWQRRSRLSTNAFRGILPLGESSEGYALDFYTTSGFTVLAGSFTATTNSFTLTAAQQTAIGLTPGAAVNVNVFQVSSSIGRGAALQGIV